MNQECILDVIYLLQVNTLQKPKQIKKPQPQPVLQNKYYSSCKNFTLKVRLSVFRLGESTDRLRESNYVPDVLSSRYAMFEISYLLSTAEPCQCISIMVLSIRTAKLLGELQPACPATGTREHNQAVQRSTKPDLILFLLLGTLFHDDT